MAAIPAYLTHARKLSFGHRGFQARFAPQSQLLDALLTKPEGRLLCAQILGSPLDTLSAVTLKTP
jgi:hypothetical protein